MFVCGCKDLGSSFTFCATHALSKKREEINNFWRPDYVASNWTSYKTALVEGLGLEPVDESHPCVTPDCKNTVAYDDEPWCYTHSPDEGSMVRGYSYKAKHA